MTDGKHRPTLADVAKDAGLSTSAASLILNEIPDSGLSEDARKRVLESALKLGYRPNKLAKALKTDVTGTIGFVSDSVVTTRFASGLINGALKAASIADQVLLVLETMGTEDGMQRSIETALDHQVDAIIIAAMQAKAIRLPKIPKSTKVILLNSINPNHSATILPDEFQGGSAAMNILVEAGFSKNIALIGKNADVETNSYRSVTVAKRTAGIRDVCNKNQIKFIASHNGYEKKFGCIHTRELSVDKLDGKLKGFDEIKKRKETRVSVTRPTLRFFRPRKENNELEKLQQRWCVQIETISASKQRR